MEKMELMNHQFDGPTPGYDRTLLRILFDPECRLNPGKVLPTGPGLHGNPPASADSRNDGLIASGFAVKSLIIPDIHNRVSIADQLILLGGTCRRDYLPGRLLG
jgi:hypothetical protein